MSSGRGLNWTPFMAFMASRRKQLESSGLLFPGGWKDVAIAVNREWVTMDDAAKEKWGDVARNSSPPPSVNRKRSSCPPQETPWSSPAPPPPAEPSSSCPPAKRGRLSPATLDSPSSTPTPSPKVSKYWSITNPFAMPSIPRVEDKIGSPLCWIDASEMPANKIRAQAAKDREYWDNSKPFRIRGGELGTGPGQPEDWVDMEKYFNIDAESALGPFAGMSNSWANNKEPVEWDDWGEIKKEPDIVPNPLNLQNLVKTEKDIKPQVKQELQEEVEIVEVHTNYEGVVVKSEKGEDVKPQILNGVVATEATGLEIVEVHTNYMVTTNPNFDPFSYVHVQMKDEEEEETEEERRIANSYY